MRAQTALQQGDAFLTDLRRVGGGGRSCSAPRKPSRAGLRGGTCPDGMRRQSVLPDATRKGGQDANTAMPPRLPNGPPTAPSEVSTPARSTTSTYYRKLQDTLLSQGLLREDIAPGDAPFGARQLVENFVKIALYDEYGNAEGRLSQGERVSELRRWEAPVKMRIEYGESVSSADRAANSALISAYAGRLARVSKHPVKTVDRGGNFTVFIVNEDERRALGPRLSSLVKGISAGTIEAITSLPPSTLCVVYSFSDGKSPVYTQAVAVIRAEHPDRLKRACINEELAQGLGLANDSLRARPPSIFNDSEEFALLTRHDEMLLKMLYDPRLKPGMKEAEARPPIVQSIATELLGGDS